MQVTNRESSDIRMHGTSQTDNRKSCNQLKPARCCAALLSTLAEGGPANAHSAKLLPAPLTAGPASPGSSADAARAARLRASLAVLRSCPHKSKELLRLGECIAPCMAAAVLRSSALTLEGGLQND